jgi:AbiV family abortive infection protein
MKRLTYKQMAEVALEVLANARRLYNDAALLQRVGRLASAFMVAGLGADELGKHVLVASFYGSREDTDEQWRKFWRRFRNHQSKLGDALLGAWMADLFTEDPPPDVATFHQERLLSTYVDIGPDGAVTVPVRLVRSPGWTRFSC